MLVLVFVRVGVEGVGQGAVFLGCEGVVGQQAARGWRGGAGAEGRGRRGRRPLLLCGGGRVYFIVGGDLWGCQYAVVCRQQVQRNAPFRSLGSAWWRCECECCRDGRPAGQGVGGLQASRRAGRGASAVAVVRAGVGVAGGEETVSSPRQVVLGRGRRRRRRRENENGSGCPGRRFPIVPNTNRGAVTSGSPPMRSG
jgi:hypothetical protein